MVNLFIMGDSAQIRAHQEVIADFEDIILTEHDGDHVSLDLATVDGLVLLDVEDKDPRFRYSEILLSYPDIELYTFILIGLLLTPY